MRRFDKQWTKIYEDIDTFAKGKPMLWFKAPQHKLLRKWYECDWHRYHDHHSDRHMKWLRLGREMIKTPEQHTAETIAIRGWVKEKMLFKY